MKFRLLFLFSLLSFSVLSQSKKQEAPQLIVGIKIDGFQAEHLRKLWTSLTPGGLKKIITESAVIDQMTVPLSPLGNAPFTATLMSGSYPSYNGVGSDQYLNREDNKLYSILFDKNQIGIGTVDKFSAHRLLASTFTDELLLANHLSQVHVVAIQAEDAVMMGGHTATSASWIDDESVRWATSGYYTKGLSRWADQMNINGSFKVYASKRWTPFAKISTYINPTEKGSRIAPFGYNPIEKRRDRPSKSILKNTPAANTLVTELAKLIVEKEELGRDINPDVLLLQYTVNAPNRLLTPLTTAEQEDLYLRLDIDIQSLISKIHASVDKDKIVFFIIGNGEGNFRSPIELGKNLIPSGLFNADRALALLNTYLMAIYGHEKWVLGYQSRNIYLNQAKIESNKINKEEFHRQVADFLNEFEGVQAAYTANQIYHFSGSDLDFRSALHNSFHKSCVGDIVLVLKPGWIEVDVNGNPIGSMVSFRQYTPFYLSGKGIKRGEVAGAYSIIDVASTITQMLCISRPNASVGKAMTGVFE